MLMDRYFAKIIIYDLSQKLMESSIIADYYFKGCSLT